MRLRDLKEKDLFRFVGDTDTLEYRGSGWYDTPKGYQGGPWHDEGENPEVTTEYRFDIRKESFEQAGELLLDKPIVFSGTREECQAYAKKVGWTWVEQTDMMFGGYWIDDDQASYLPT